MSTRSPVEFTDTQHRRVGNQVVITNGSSESIPVTIPVSSPLATQFGDSPSIDAFARARFSEPFTIFDSKQIWDDPDLANNVENYPLFWDNQQASGSGTSTTFNVDRASTTLAVSNLTAGTRIRQTKQRFNYQPGKSQLVILTGVFGLPGLGITKRAGLFDANNGLFFESEEADFQVTIRSNATGSPVDTAIKQSSWNMDTLDGNGPSGITLNPANSQIFFFDFEWLGVGRVRFGFFIDGIPVYCHESLNANVLDVVYMSTPNLPIRYEISNDGTGGEASIEGICTTVISEGGVQPNGVFRSPDPSTSSSTVIQANTVGTTYAVAAIRLKTAYLSAQVDVVKASLIATTADDFMWSLHINPTLSASLTYGTIPNSAIEYAFGNTTSPGTSLTDEGTVLDSGFVSTDLESAIVNLTTALRLGAAIDGTQDFIVLGATPIGSNLDIRGVINWREVW